MTEIFELMFGWQNIIPTTLLTFVVVYWLIVILGLIDHDSINVDIDHNVDVDIDHDVDFDLHHDIDVDHAVSIDVDHDVDMDHDTDVLQGGVSWFNHVLYFFNLGRIPFMIWLTFLVIPLWFCMIVLNELIHNSSFLISLVLFVPVFIGSLFISKFMTMPFIKVFEQMQNPEKNTDPTGKVCKAIIEVNADYTSQAEVNVDDSYQTIYVRTRPGVTVPKGATGLVINKHESGNYYIIEPYELG